MKVALRRSTPGALAAALAAAVLLAACGSDKPKPTPLEPVTAKFAGRQVWQARVEGIKFVLAVAARGGNFFAAGDDGTVLALDATTGRELWRAQSGARLSAGVGSDGRFAAVVTVDNEVVVFDAGRQLWKSRLGSRVVTAPLVAGERVFVMGVDRVVTAFDALDGRRLWALQRPGEALTLAQGGVLTTYKDTLVAGQGPRLTGVDPMRGTVRWEASIGSPRGTNEVERLSDLVGPALRLGDTFCVRSFQSAVGCVDADKGTLRWSRNVGGLQAVGGDDSVIVGADASDRITAWRQSSGEVMWSNEKLAFRGLSGALGAGKAVVFGDAEGQLHFLDRDTGEFVLRLATDGSQIVGTPVLSGTTMLVATRAGGLFAFRPE
ncbi:MAG TPA: outer membrane protein assembly factor BamB [Rubrivivax sp.]